MSKYIICLNVALLLWDLLVQRDALLSPLLPSMFLSHARICLPPFMCIYYCISTIMCQIANKILRSMICAPGLPF